MGRAGKLEIVLDYVRLADIEKVAVRAVKDAKGGSHTAGMTAGIVATGLLFWPAAPFFLFMHGHDITVPKGAEVTAYVNGDMKLNPAKFKFQQASSAPVQETTTSSSQVTITSTPAGAEIYLDQNFMGDTPSTVNAPSGRHSITVKKAGYQDWTREMNFSGGTISLVAELTSGSNTPVPSAQPAAAPPPAAPVRKTFTVTEVSSSTSERMQASKSQDASSVAVDTPPGWIGVSTKPSEGGAKVTAVAPNGPAAQAGIQVGDIIQQLNGKTIKDQDFESEIANFKPGTKVLISYMRSAWARDTLVTVSKNPAAN
jgi:hypothetical protein